MIEDFNLKEQIKSSAGIRLCVLFGSFFILLILSSIISIGINNSPIGDSRDKLLTSSVVQCLLAFCIPSYLLARFISKKPFQWLRITTPPCFKALCGIIIVYFLSFPAMECIIDWNRNVHFPESLSAVESMLREMENANNAVSSTILEARGWLSICVGVIVVGLITGFSEELFFRGSLQTIFINSIRYKSVAIFVSAFIFSVMHFQFFGFVPRLIMGIFFGYLLVWSQSLWVPVFAHFLNNSIVVVVYGLSPMDEETIMFSGKNGFSIYLIIISVCLTILFFLFFRNLFFCEENKNRVPWQKIQQHQISSK